MTTGYGDPHVDRAIARHLRVTWSAFFAKFGRLTPVQRIAIPPILDGRDVVVTAPTASGKTEAVCAPLIERWHDQDDWMVLYISPTRALVNDLYSRLAGPVENLGCQLARRTGDHNQRPPAGTNLLLTTPESFDSLLCRARDTRGHFLQRVCAVVLDEVHLLHGTARGEQLRYLLKRLCRIREEVGAAGPQVAALSATVDDPEGIRRMFAPSAVFVEAPGARTIERVSVADAGATVEEQLPVYLRQLDTSEKILVFSNSRKRVDALAHLFNEVLAPLEYIVRAHHGSLSRKLREEAEEAARKLPRLVLCSSSTLEVGVDIGDIDLVVLDGPAPDLLALLQRIGRGNRRTGRTRVMACAGSVTELLVQAAMLGSAERGYLGKRERGPQFAVARQQIASYIFQRLTGQRTAAQLEAFVSDMLPDVDVRELIDHMVSGSELLPTSSALRLGYSWLELAETGGIHSNIESMPGQSVSDEKSGDEIASGVRFREGPAMKIAGRMLQVRDWDDFRVVVCDTKRSDVGEAKWNYVVGPRLKGAGQADAVREFLGIRSDHWPVVSIGGQTVVFHFGGGRRRAVLELMGMLYGDDLGEIDEWALYPRASRSRPQWSSTVDATAIGRLVDRNLTRLERVLARPQANKALPKSLRSSEVVGWLEIDREASEFSRSRWEPPVDSEQRLALEGLAQDLMR